VLYTELPDLVEHVITLPVTVNVVPGDVAAGRVSRPGQHRAVGQVHLRVHEQPQPLPPPPSHRGQSMTEQDNGNYERHGPAYAGWLTANPEGSSCCTAP
jgi:hypothetical protein